MVELNLPVAVGIIAAIIGAGVGGMWMAEMMTEDTLLMMVLPSMVGFAAVIFVIGVFHGQYRANAAQ